MQKDKDHPCAGSPRGHLQEDSRSPNDHTSFLTFTVSTPRTPYTSPVYNSVFLAKRWSNSARLKCPLSLKSLLFSNSEALQTVPGEENTFFFYIWIFVVSYSKDLKLYPERVTEAMKDRRSKFFSRNSLGSRDVLRQESRIYHLSSGWCNQHKQLPHACEVMCFAKDPTALCVVLEALLFHTYLLSN